MAMSDPRDPRNVRQPSVQESMAELSAGLNAFLTRQDSMFSEVLETQREITRSLHTSQRVVKDRLTAQRGASGLPASMPPQYEDRLAIMNDFAPPSGHAYLAPPSGGPQLAPPEIPTYANPALVDPSLMFDTEGRSRLTDYTLDGGKGQLAAQSRSGLKAGVYASLAGRANEARREMMVGAGYVLNPTTGGYLDSMGNEVSAAEAAMAAASADGNEGSARRLAMTSAAARAAQAWRDGAPIGRSLMSIAPAGLLKGAGLVGAGLAVGNQALDFYQGEMGKINESRAIFGDISAGEAYGMRAEDWITTNLKGRFSSLGSGAYGQLVSAGREQALKGSAFDNYVDTGADIMRTGVSGRQTTQIMNMILEAGSGLEGLAESLKLVTSAAKDAGLNAGRARDIFIANYEASSNVMFGASGATRTQTAASLTAAQVNQGREFQSVSYAASFNDPMQNRMTAASAGISNTEMLSLRQSNPAQAAMMDETRQLDMLDGIPTSSGKSVRTLVQEFVAMNNGYDPTYDQDALGAWLLTEGGIDPLVAKQYLGALNIQVSEGQALGVLGQMFTEESAAKQLERDAEASRATFAPSRDVSGLDSFVTTNGAGAFGFTGSTTDESGLRFDYAMGLNGGEKLGDEAWTDLKAQIASGAVETSPVAEALINESANMGITQDSKVRVRDGDGYRVVTMTEALRNYRDQIQGGTAQFVEGVGDEAMNQTVAQALGMPTDMVTGDTTSYESARNRRPDEIGTPFEEWKKTRDRDNKSNPDNSSASGSESKVVFDLTPEARRILQPVGSDPYMNSEPMYYSGAEN